MKSGTGHNLNKNLCGSALFTKDFFPLAWVIILFGQLLCTMKPHYMYDMCQVHLHSNDMILSAMATTRENIKWLLF